MAYRTEQRENLYGLFERESARVLVRFLSQLFRPNSMNRRVFSGLCAAFLLATLLFSSAFVADEADHDCSGHDCPTCLVIQNCIANLQLLGSSPGGTATVSAPAVSSRSDAVVVCAYRAPSTTLKHLDVRFDE